MHITFRSFSNILRAARRVLPLFAVLLLAMGPAKAQVVNFPDSNLESAVRDALQIYAPTNIYRTNMITLTNLSAGFRGIQNLSGLETATNLTVLDLSYNSVTGFSALTGMPHLVQLSIPGNQLQTLAGVGAAPSIKLMDAGNNSLTNLAGLTGMTNLIRLWVGGNQLIDLSGVQAAASLTNLDAGFCQLTNISAVTGLWHMVQFTAPWNHYWDASALNGLTNMVYMDIGGNRGPLDISITNVGFLAAMKHLQWLSLYYLRVQDFTSLTGLSPLTNLDVSFNSAPTNVAALNGLTNLLFFHITSDNISNITFLSHMPLLKDLDFGYNQVTDLSPAVGHSFTSLMVYYNPLTNVSLVSGMHSLTRLSVGGTALSTVSFLSGLTNLVELWFDGNPGVASLSPILGLTNLQHLDVDSDAMTDLASVTALKNLNNLEMSSQVLAPNVSFLSQMTNLNSLDISYDGVGDLSVLAPLNVLNTLYANDNFLSDIGPLLSLPFLNYVNVEDNVLDLTPTSMAWNEITNLENNFVQVDYSPQSISSTIKIWDSPLDLCISNNASAYFAISATTTSGDLTVQWQFNGSNIPGQTNDVLFLSNVHSNQAGLYRVVLTDDNGKAASSAAHLYVGDPNCGQTVFISQQPANTVAAAGDFVSFTVNAYTTLANTNLDFQWQFNGTNIDGATDSELDLFSVDTSSNGFYQVFVSDADNHVVASAAAQLRVVDVVPFTSPSFSNMVYQALVQQGYTPPGAIHLTDLDHLSYLSLNSQGITNITGLECARYLNWLDLGGNQISDPSPISWLTDLNYLYLSGCGLEDASFISPLYNLQQVDLSDNTIHSIPVMSELLNLNYLNLSYNECLINLPRLAVLTNMSNLSLHSDCLPDIAFCSGMAFLNTLDAGGDGQYDQYRNFVPDMSPLLGKSQMNWLSLSWDEVTNVPIVATFTNLQHLFLSSNHFDNVMFLTNLPGLQEFAINYSQVTNITYLTNKSYVTNSQPLYDLDVSYIPTTNLSAVAGLTGLTTLWCGGDHAGGGGSYLAGLTNLNTLGCEMNGVTNIGFVTNKPHLYYLVLENNAITNISLVAGRTNFQYLYLSGNQIHDLTPLTSLTNLGWLSLSANGFTNITPLAGLYGLQWLSLQSNYIQNISALAGLTNLYWGLDISGNQITDLSPVTNLHILTSLNPYQNRLSKLPSLVSMTGITSLDFWGNQLTNVSGVSGMVNLNWLGLSRNHMTVVTPLADLPNLRTIDLYTNDLTDVSAVSGLTGLTWLNMNDNDLQSISSILGLTNLIYVGLEYNELNINPGSPVLTDIATMQNHGTYVDYIPQKSFFLTSPMLIAPGQFQFTIQGSAGTTVRVWASTNLMTWSSLGYLTNTNGVVTFTDTSATNKVKSYRAQQL